MIDPVKELPRKFSEKLSEDHRQMYSNMVRVLNSYVIDFVPMNIRYFTRHGRIHSKKIIQILDNLLYDDALKNLTSTELLILLCSAWLHDIGLLVNRDENGRKLEDKEIRERHHELSKHYILRKEVYSQIGFDNELFIAAVAEVCYRHSRKAGKIDNVSEKTIVFGEFVHLKFLAGLFRLADALDIGSERAPIILIHDLAVLPERSDIHWKMSRLMDITYGYDAEKTIYVTGLYKDPEEKEMVSWKFYDVCDEFEGVKAHLKIGDDGVIWGKIEGTLTHKDRMDICKLTPDDVDKEARPFELLVCEKNKVLHEKEQEYLFAADWCNQAIHYLEKYLNDLRYVLYLGSEFKKDIRKNRISEDLKRIFKTNQLNLSKKAKISEKNGNEWIIQDNEKKYLIRESGGKLRVFSLHKSDERIENTEDRIRKYYEEILEYYKKEMSKGNDNFMSNGYFIRTFQRYYSLKSDKFCNGNLSNEDEQFLNDMETLWKYLDAIEDRVFYGESYMPLSILLRSGRSPLRKLLKKRLISCIEEDVILDGNDFKYSVHNGCCECTARLVTTLILMGKTLWEDIESAIKFKGDVKYDIKKSVDWLKQQDGENKYSVIDKKKKGIEYTHVVLEALTNYGDMETAKKAFETIIKEKWVVKSFPEGSTTENISKVMYAISMYFQKIMFRDSEEGEYKKNIESLLKRRKIVDFLEGFKSKSYSEWEQYPLLDGLIGIILLKSLINETFGEELDLAEKIIELIRKDPVIQDPKYLWTMRMTVLVNLTYGWLLYLEAKECFGHS